MLSNIVLFFYLICSQECISVFGKYNLKGDNFFDSYNNTSRNKFTISDQFQIQTKQKVSKKKNKKYDILFNELYTLNKLNETGQNMVKKLQTKFYNQYDKYKNQITSLFQNLNINEEIQTNAKAHKIDQEIGSHTYGLKSKGKYAQIIISGAKGKREKKISSLGISEIVEAYNTALTVAYGYLTDEGHYFIDAKVNEENEDCQINEENQLEIIEAVSDKYLLHEQKTALGVTKLYRLLIGRDYIKLIIQLLVAGASVKDKSVLSKSTISLENILIYKQNQKIQTKCNKGYFESDNHTNKQKSISNHHGYLIEDNKHGKGHQKTNSKSIANQNGTNIKTRYRSNRFFQLNYNVLIIIKLKVLIFQKFLNSIIIVKINNQKILLQTTYNKITTFTLKQINECYSQSLLELQKILEQQSFQKLKPTSKINKYEQLELESNRLLKFTSYGRQVNGNYKKLQK